ncbi:MFS transporter [Sporomusa acidovorans]|uniref:Multidrug resistance protein MdtH n=1 Tax=Sporomusa acidovorans (strain ATCC 49682 / DSM 3132 / Mol) TaxID=1123286 RepID=A0ABZ3J1I4_SPOA4|nr:MFS transporter [Sporomusa acidovorans]OZC18072.1 multidrug resistance protein MdtH [Sporomusa acidovorans DSM 3132]SDF72934.1 Sugar phosphate permease [Sporomusa acidovorans]
MHKNIILLGLVSLFTDISSEMIYPLVPLYLTAVLGASPAALGIIEGIAESLASLLKIGSGRLADRLEKRKPLAIAGYGLSAVGKVLFVVATSWTGILWARVSDRFGKGIRTAPRDALIADACDDQTRGKAFGLHRAMDTAGAVIGIGLAYWLFTRYNGHYITVFWLSVIPAVIGVLLLFLVSDAGKSTVQTAKKLTFSWRELDSRLKYFIIVSFLFNLGNSSNQFLLVRAGTVGFDAAQVILLYLLMNVTYLLISYPAGLLSDRVGRRALLVAGYLVYGLVYLGFALAQSAGALIVLFGIYGLYTGLTEGVEKALLADIAPGSQKASVYGLHALVVGAALLPASVIAGFLWDAFGAAAPFWFGGVTGLLAAGAIWLGLRQ